MCPDTCLIAAPNQLILAPESARPWRIVANNSVVAVMLGYVWLRSSPATFCDPFELVTVNSSVK